MLTCSLNSASRVTLTDQLYQALRAEIDSGHMAPGDKLPSKRQLAEHLHVSTATVEAAYGRLASEGYCESRPRSGMYVAQQLPRAGVAALAHFNRLLDGGRFERLEEREDGTFTAYFTGWKGEKILVYWTPDHDTDGAPDGVFALPKGIRPLAVCDMEGRSLTTLPLSCEPVYVIYR